MECVPFAVRAVALCLCLTGFAACNNCEKLVEKVCSDLGADDCAYWKQHGGADKLIPGGRGVNRACGMMLGDAVYPPLLKGQRDMVKAYRTADAAKAGKAP